MVIKPQFGKADEFSEHLAFVWGQGSLGRGYIDKAGRMVIRLKGDSGGKFSEGFAAVRFEGKFGYIDKMGRKAIAPQFDRADAFCDGVAKVEIGEKIGYIDKMGRYIWTPTE